MKHIIKSIAAVAVMISFAACNNFIEQTESITVPETTLTLRATREGLQPGTRSFRLDDGSVWWNPEEEVSVFYGSGTNGGSKFVSMNTTIAETTELSGSIQMSGTAKDFWAVYPYSTDNSCDGSSVTTVIPAMQTGVEGNFSDDVFPAIAKGNSTYLPFWNICGGIKFFVSRSDIISVTVKGNNGETLAGKVRVVFNAEGKPEVTEVFDGKTEVTLVAPDGGTFKPGKYYYITLLPVAFDDGITLTFYTSSEKGEIVSDKAQTIKRSIFGVLKNVDSKVTEWESTVAEPEWVDLGLSVKWATFNVGATKPEEYGDYFAWGETEPYYSSQDPLTWKDGKSSGYNWASYKWCNGNSNTQTKYNTNSSYGTVDNKTVLDPEDDAAHVNWGGTWRMPTDIEWVELINNCTLTWTGDYNGTGVAGTIITSKKTGYTDKSIFLPAACLRDGTYLGNAVSYGYYWSSSLYTDRLDTAFYVYCYSDGVYRYVYGRYLGLSVRPVYGEFIPVSSITLSDSSLNLEVGSSEQLVATIAPSNATEPSVRWVSGDESIVTVDGNGNVSAVAEGMTTVTAYASNGLSASCVVKVYQPLQSIVSIPDMYYGGFKAFKYYYVEYVAGGVLRDDYDTVDDLGNEAEIYAKDTLYVTGRPFFAGSHATAHYLVNPNDYDLDNAEWGLYNNDDSGWTPNIISATRQNANPNIVDIVYTVIGNHLLEPVDFEDDYGYGSGVSTMHLNGVDAFNESRVVSSDITAVIPMKQELAALAFTKYYPADAERCDVNYDHLWLSAHEAVENIPSVRVSYNAGHIPLDFVGIHIFDADESKPRTSKDSHTLITLATLKQYYPNLDMTFEFVPCWINGFPEEVYGKIILNDGKWYFAPCYPDAQGYPIDMAYLPPDFLEEVGPTAVGHRPVILVKLIDKENRDAIIFAGYFKIEIVSPTPTG